MAFKQKVFLEKLLLVSASLFLAVLTAEIILRVYGYSYVPLKLQLVGRENEISGLKGDWRQYHSQKDAYFVFDPYLIWRPNKDNPFFNSQGFRGPVVNRKKRDKDYYIFTIGDSNTLGPQHGPGWVEYLAQMLQEKYPAVHVVNAGAWGYSSFQCRRRLDEVLRYKPDLVILSCCSNDALRVTIPDREYLASKGAFPYIFSRLRICQLLWALHDRLLLHRSRKALLIPRVGLREWETYLHAMIRAADKNGLKMVLLTRPFFDFSPRDNTFLWRNYTPLYNESTLRASGERGVLAAIDVYSSFKGKKEYFGDEAHFNDGGNRRMAKMVYAVIERYLSTHVN